MMNTNSPEQEDLQGKSGTSENMRWYYGQDGQAVGPLPFASIETLVKAGQLLPDVFVIREGCEDWQPLSAIVPQSSAIDAEDCTTPQKLSEGQSPSEPSTPQQTKDAAKEIPPMQALLLTAFAFISLWFYLTKIQPQFEASTNTISTKSKAPLKAEPGGRNMPPPGIARDTAPSAIARKSSSYSIMNADGSQSIGDDGGQLIGHLVDFLYLGTVSEERASNCLFTEKAAPCFVSQVLTDFVICEAPRYYDGTQHVEFAFRRRDVGLEHLPILEFKGYAHYYGRRQFTTQTGAVKSVPVFEVVKDVN